MNEDTWENLDTSEWRDSEMIREHLNEAPIRFREKELKAENEYFWDDGLRMIKLKKTPKLLRMGEKNSHNENNYERKTSS